MARSKLAGAALALIAGFALATTGLAEAQARSPVTSRDKQAGAQSHPQILSEFGGEMTGPLSAYVKGVGEKMATAAGLPNTCLFTVINSDVVNAFAVPGCYIYITRGLLAIMGSEDELASVLGHEVGHITGEHSRKQQQRQTLGTLGAIAVGVLTKNQELMQVAGQAAQLYSLSYSRNQEFEADDRGVAGLRTAGYNLYAAAEMLNALGVNDAVTAKTAGRDTQSATPTWARTHPLTSDRVARAANNARALGAAPGAAEQVRPYLSAINGMLYGDDPEQGFVNGNTFAHPKLKIAFDAPQGFTLSNGSQAITIAGPNSQRAMFSGGALPNGSLETYTQQVLQQVVGKAPARVGQGQRTTTNGVDTAILPAQAQTQQGQIVDVVVTAYRVGAGAYHFVTIAPQGGGGQMSGMLRSFRMLNDSEVASLRPRVVQVVDVRQGDTVQSLASRMAFKDFQVDRFAALNSLDPARPLTPGSQVKLIVLGR
ncbi:MAG: M48 family metalloprotease [Caulobacterales bacterium]